MKSCIYFLVILSLISCQSQAGKTGLDQLLQDLYEKGLFNGAIIVTENDSVVLSEGFGYANFESQVPFGINTPMDTGSITKTFTALAMLMLADSNDIDLNTPANVFIQDFPYKSITIRHLLEQTSGIVSDDYVFERAAKDTPLTNRTFLEYLIRDKPGLEFTPGSRFMYNGMNHRLLAIIIESISEVSYEEFINDNIAEPLELEDWFLRPVSLEDLPNNHAVGYSFEHDTIKANDSEDYEAFYGDCNLFFSAKDLSRWSRSFISNSPFQGDKLSRALQTKSTLSDFNILHWYSLANVGEYHFTGDWKGFYAMVYFDISKKRSIVYLTNTNIAHWLRPMIVRTINEYLNAGSTSNWKAPDPIVFEDEEITGIYQLNDEQIAHVYREEGSLIIDVNDKSVGLFRLDSDFYYAPGLDLWIWFSIGDNEKVSINCSSIYGLNIGSKT